MGLLEIVTELEIDAPAANTVSPLRLLAIGKYLGLTAGQTVIDFGCGRGEMLCLWAKHFGTIGIGIDKGRMSLTDAASRADRWGIGDKVEFICQDVKQYDAGATTFHVAACMGATMGFGGFGSTLRHLKGTIRAGGSIVVSEPFYSSKQVPQELIEYEGDYHTEPELFDIARSEGVEVGYYTRATPDEWDRYIFSSHKTEMQELLAVSAGREREERKARLHRWQDMYIRYRQHWQGMAFMTLHPA